MHIPNHRGHILFAALLLAVTTLPLPAAEVRLKLQHFLGAESIPHRQLIEPWAKRVETDSGGRIAVEIYPAMGLGGKAPQLIDQVQQGEVDIVWTAAAYTPGRFPRTDLFSLPTVHRGDPVATNLAIREMLSGALAADFPKLKPLLVHVHQGHAFHMGGKEVNGIDGFDGLVIRPPGRGIGAWTIESLGAETTKKRHPKLPKAIAGRQLDGALMSFNLAESMGVIEAARSHTILAEEEFFGTSIFLFLMNEARYLALPEELRAVIERNSGAELAAEMGRVWRDAGMAGMAAARKRGNRINQLRGGDAAAARERLQQVVARWRESRARMAIDSDALVEQARQAIARHSAD
ncbi:MAG: C4-dicarboxylate ABC transporter substrate-binding protein [Gammaproteobacteria bacterium]|nr:C4-dicarboxylate ABC transporter substrate-binding protein [Gammaproteobacteria bacterium]